jgi:hypothetical protein
MTLRPTVGRLEANVTTSDPLALPMKASAVSRPPRYHSRCTPPVAVLVDARRLGVGWRANGACSRSKACASTCVPSARCG